MVEYESFYEAQRRIPSQREKIINLLREAGEEGVTTSELNAVCFRYGARLAELYKEGFVITKEQIKDGLYKYVLKAVPGELKYYANAEDQIIADINNRFNGSVTMEQLVELLYQHDFKIVRNPGWYQKRSNPEFH